MIGNHLPRQCGIATFTTDLSDALGLALPDLECSVVAMNDGENRHDYGARVRWQVPEADLEAYRRTAEGLNAQQLDVVCVQHEYGIYGGRAGSHLLALLRELRTPIVTTLHTILAEPSADQRAVMDELTRLSERLVVMSERGVELLHRVHQVPTSKIDVIPHGIPTLPDAARSKERLGLGRRPVLLTFGLLSPDKGIEYVIDAMPEILEHHPDAVYVILGATHPHVRAAHGETYRRMLEARTRSLGLGASVIFHDRFVQPSELTEFLAAADLYITPYLKPEQITSGTLAYAVGSGKATLSTPYWYARELLADGRGMLIPWRDPGAIARATCDLFRDDAKRLEMCRLAAAYGQDMAWPAVAQAYARTFDAARSEHAKRQKSAFALASAHSRRRLPEINLEHLRLLTDPTGILQHAAFSVPRYEDGYCLDDNARALIAMVTLTEDEMRLEPNVVRALESRYLAFVRHAWNPELGRFRNFMGYDRVWREACGSEDSHGRAVWALGTLAGRSRDPLKRRLGADLFHAALHGASAFTSPRAWSFALLGIDAYLASNDADEATARARTLFADQLLRLLERSSTTDWPWFEASLTYCNARLPHALLVSGERTGRTDLREAGLRSLEWLVSVQRSPAGHFAPIGTNGFYERGKTRTSFDQQPVEALATVSACLAALRVSNDARWTSHAQRAFEWYLGHNDLQQPLYDAASGGCRDGLHADRVNENQGAESTLSFLLALLELRAVERASLVANHNVGARPSASADPPRRSREPSRKVAHGPWRLVAPASNGETT